MNIVNVRVPAVFVATTPSENVRVRYKQEMCGAATTQLNETEVRVVNVAIQPFVRCLV